jgi:hypothetical protein
MYVPYPGMKRKRFILSAAHPRPVHIGWSVHLRLDLRLDWRWRDE